MRGMGFIENIKTDYMLSALINIHLLRASLIYKVKIFFSFSTFVYNGKNIKNFYQGS